MRTLSRSFVVIVGVMVLVVGIVFIFQSGSAKQQLADSIAPLPLNQVSARYDAVTENQKVIMAEEEPNIQTGKAAPSAMYNLSCFYRLPCPWFT